jgi:meso-butanediol dehydrogenase/(S,S)-butanediol dehydrogenase/diacetyl reductase
MSERRALIVGGSGGIGSAVAIALAHNGITSALIGRNSEKLTENVKACIKAGEHAYAVVCNISKTATIKGAVAKAIDKLGGLNYLINCAGTSIPGKLHEVDLDDCDTILDTNLRAHYYFA